MILPKTSNFFFNFKHQLLHIFLWDGQKKEMPYDQLAEESQNICLIFPWLAMCLINFSVNFKRQLLHIFPWVGQYQDMPYDQLAKESKNISFISSLVSYISVNMSVYEQYISFHKVILAAISP